MISRTNQKQLFETSQITETNKHLDEGDGGCLHWASNPPLFTRKHYHSFQMHFSDIETVPNQLFTLLFTSDGTRKPKEMLNTTRLAPNARFMESFLLEAFIRLR